jgi:hypothetical protein
MTDKKGGTTEGHNGTPAFVKEGPQHLAEGASAANLLNSTRISTGDGMSAANMQKGVSAANMLNSASPSTASNTTPAVTPPTTKS